MNERISLLWAPLPSYLQAIPRRHALTSIFRAYHCLYFSFPSKLYILVKSFFKKISRGIKKAPEKNRGLSVNHSLHHNGAYFRRPTSLKYRTAPG